MNNKDFRINRTPLVRLLRATIDSPERATACTCNLLRVCDRRSVHTHTQPSCMHACVRHGPKIEVGTTSCISWGNRVHAIGAPVGPWPSEANEMADRMARMNSFGLVRGPHSKTSELGSFKLKPNNWMSSTPCTTGQVTSTSDDRGGNARYTWVYPGWLGA